MWTGFNHFDNNHFDIYFLERRFIVKDLMSKLFGSK